MRCTNVMPSELILVKHAQPILDPAVPPKYWQLSPEGENQAERLARVLVQFMPFTLASSTEPKAQRTAEIAGEALGVQIHTVEGLHEFDRPALPIMSAVEHERLNTAIFDDLSRVMIGSESGAQALARFTAGVHTALETAAGSRTLVTVAHGTVISLLVAAHNTIDPRGLWKRLQCPSFIVLALPGFRLVRVEDNPIGGSAIPKAGFSSPPERR
jgi:broad specificity phosphatase PhoE